MDHGYRTYPSLEKVLLSPGGTWPNVSEKEETESSFRHHQARQSTEQAPFGMIRQASQPHLLRPALRSSLVLASHLWALGQFEWFGNRAPENSEEIFTSSAKLLTQCQPLSGTFVDHTEGAHATNMGSVERMGSPCLFKLVVQKFRHFFHRTIIRNCIFPGQYAKVLFNIQFIYANT